MKIQRQSSSPVSTPPISTPMPETSSVAAPHMPIAVPRRSPVKTFVSTDIEEGMISAPPLPARAMPAIRTSIPGAAAARIEPAANSAVPSSRKRLRPKTSASRPAAIRKAEKGIMNAVTVHCSSAIEVPNSPWIAGSATTTAAVGSWTMPAAATTAVSVSGRLVGRVTAARVYSRRAHLAAPGRGAPTHYAALP